MLLVLITMPLVSFFKALAWAITLFYTGSLAAQSANVDTNDYSDFQQQYASALSDFSGNLGGFQTAFTKASTGRGLEHYDHTNDLETLLKNTVNLNKEVLQSTYDTVNALPVVGPVLGPSQYSGLCPREKFNMFL
jgi:hypothetical protein